MKSLYQLCLERVKHGVSLLPKTIQQDVYLTRAMEEGGKVYLFEKIQNVFLIQKDFSHENIVAVDVLKMMNAPPNQNIQIRLLKKGEGVDLSLNGNFISFVDKEKDKWPLSVARRHFITRFIRVDLISSPYSIPMTINLKRLIGRLQERLDKYHSFYIYLQDHAFRIDDNEIYNSFIVLKHPIPNPKDKDVFFLKEINPRFFLVLRKDDKARLYSIVIGNLLNSDINKITWGQSEDEFFLNNGLLLYNQTNQDNSVMKRNGDRIEIETAPPSYTGLILCGDQNSVLSYASALEERRRDSFYSFPDLSLFESLV